MMQGKILLIEDDPRVQKNNKEILERQGYEISLAMNLTEARKIIAADQPDAIVLDVGLPDGDGIDYLKELRQTLQIPVLILTAAQSSQSAADGFEAGGDDYLRKPYDLKEFRARINALMRRSAKLPECVTINKLKIDLFSLRAFVNDEDLTLTQKEFALLNFFVQNEGKFISLNYLYTKIWNQPMGRDDNAIKSVVSRLRKKLANAGCTIMTERGEGYCFCRIN